MDKILLLGATGQLGRLVAETAPPSCDLVCYPRDKLDITDKEAVERTVSNVKPACIVNTAAYTAVDRAEAEPEAAFRVNAAAVENIARAAPAGTRIIHVSTDFVFEGTSREPYKPGDETSPLSVYGKSKLAGEQALLENHPENAVILRTSWLYSGETRNFVTTMLALMKERDMLNVVNDQLGSPTSAYTLAGVIWRFTALEAVSGIYHWSDRGVITWYDFACEIHRKGLELGLLENEIQIDPVGTKDYRTAAARPAYSALDSSTTETLLGIRTLPWREQLHNVLVRIKESL